MELFDSHNHLQSGSFGKDAGVLVEEMRSRGISGCVVNATGEEDWEAVRRLAADFPGFVKPAYGIHPWNAATVTEGWEERLEEILCDDPAATVGEIGVDGWVDAPSMEVQEEVFRKQVGIAARLGRVVTVHCLKAWEPLFSAMEELDQWPDRFLMHSFGGSIEVAERLLKKGAWFSFSGYFLQPRKARVLDVFRSLPVERILLETDAPEMMPPEEFVGFPLGEGINHPGNLRKIAGEFEREMGGQLSPAAEEESRRSDRPPSFRNPLVRTHAGVFGMLAGRAGAQVHIEFNRDAFRLGGGFDHEDDGDFLPLGEGLIGEQRVAVGCECQPRRRDAVTSDGGDALPGGRDGFARFIDKGQLDPAVLPYEELEVGFHLGQDAAVVGSGGCGFRVFRVIMTAVVLFTEGEGRECKCG
eukprot:g3560.t1